MNLFSVLLSIAALATPSPMFLGASQPVHGVWPLDPHSVVRGFEPPADTYSAGHRGVDLAGSLGAPVLASLEGTVSFAGTIAGRGVVVVNHGDTRTTYEPVIADVHQGDAVSSGEQIGTLDVTDSHCFPSACLHWGWLRESTYLDPLLLVGDQARVRLLPLTPVGVLDDRQP